MNRSKRVGKSGHVPAGEALRAGTTRAPEESSPETTISREGTAENAEQRRDSGAGRAAKPLMNRDGQISRRILRRAALPSRANLRSGLWGTGGATFVSAVFHQKIDGGMGTEESGIAIAVIPMPPFVCQFRAMEQPGWLWLALRSDPAKAEESLAGDWRRKGFIPLPVIPLPCSVGMGNWNCGDSFPPFRWPSQD